MHVGIQVFASVATAVERPSSRDACVGLRVKAKYACVDSGRRRGKQFLSCPDGKSRQWRMRNLARNVKDSNRCCIE